MVAVALHSSSSPHHSNHHKSNSISRQTVRLSPCLLLSSSLDAFSDFSRQLNLYLALELRPEKQSNTWIPIWDSINRIIASGILESLFISFGEVECSIFVQFIKQYHFTSPRVLLVSGNRMPYTVNGIFIPNVTLVVSALLQPFLPYFFSIKTYVFIWSLRLKDYTEGERSEDSSVCKHSLLKCYNVASPDDGVGG